MSEPLYVLMMTIQIFTETFSFAHNYLGNRALIILPNSQSSYLVPFRVTYPNSCNVQKMPDWLSRVGGGIHTRQLQLPQGHIAKEQQNQELIPELTPLITVLYSLSTVGL